MVSSPTKGLRRIRIISLVLSVCGIGLSGYSVYVSYRKNADKDYHAYCDIDDSISCSKIFTSKYGKGFGFLGNLLGTDSPVVVSNGLYGIIFYTLVIVLGELTSVTAAQIQKFFVLFSNFMSVYLAYILFFVLKDICVVCITMYILNILLTICCFVKVSFMTNVKSKKKGSSKSNNNNNNKKAKQNANKNANAKPAKQNSNAKQNATNAKQNASNSKPNTPNAKQNSKQNSANANKSPKNSNKSPNSKKNK